MKIDKKYTPETACLKPAKKDRHWRQNLQNVWVDTLERRAVATDGHILAVVPVEPDEGDTTGYLSPEALKAGRKDYKDACILYPDADHITVGSTKYERPNPGEFPRYHQVFPEYKPQSETAHQEGMRTVCLNAELLLRIQKALGCDGLRLHIPAPQLTAYDQEKGKDGRHATIMDAIRVEPQHVGHGSTSEGFGVIMPMRGTDWNNDK